MIDYARAGDTVLIASTDRAARSVIDLNQIVGELLAKGAAVEFVSERLAFSPGSSDPFAELQLNLLGSFAQFERSIIRERQAEGIRAAKARGVYQGRAPWVDADGIAQARGLISEGVPKAKIARRLGVDRTTLYRALVRQEGEQ